MHVQGLLIFSCSIKTTVTCLIYKNRLKLQEWDNFFTALSNKVIAYMSALLELSSLKYFIFSLGD